MRDESSRINDDVTDFCFLDADEMKSVPQANRPSEAPLPLFPPISASAPYPLEALGVLQHAAEAIARKVQVPAAMAAQSVLAVAALAAQAHCNVVLPYGQKRPLSLFMATVAASGDRKSTADNEASWPIAKREAVLREAHRDEMKDWHVEHAAWQAQKRKIEAENKLGRDERADKLSALGPEPEKPLEPFLTVSDLTLDGLTKNWANAHPSLAIFTAEGATFTSGHGMSNESRLRTAGSLNEVWDGKPIKRLRALDGVTNLPGRRLSLHVMIQPAASRDLIANPALSDLGLLSRILVAAPESIAGSRFYREPDASDDAAIRAFGGRILALLETPAPMAMGTRNELEPRDLPMAREASTLWVEFHNHVEGQSGSTGELAALKDFASKAGEHVARIAGVLTVARDVQASAIGLGEMESAIQLVNWYLGEAERLQSISRIEPRLLRASILLDWLRTREGSVIRFNEIQRLGPNSLRPKPALQEAVSILSEHHWIYQVSARPLSYGLNRAGEA